MFDVVSLIHLSSGACRQSFGQRDNAVEGEGRRSGHVDVVVVFVPGDVERAAKVTVEYTNRWNKRKKLTADGLLARCIQHELDHLQGVLFIDVARSIRQGDKKQQ